MNDTNESKYGIMWSDENALMGGFFDTEQEAIDDFVLNTGMTWDELSVDDDHYVRLFTPHEQKESESWPEI